MHPLRSAALLMLFVVSANGQAHGIMSHFDWVSGSLKGLVKWIWPIVSDFGTPTEDPQWDHSWHKDHDFGSKKHKMWQEMKVCHAKCGPDEACHKSCPKPWKHIQEKCEKFKAIQACHMACHHDHECHEKCPMPECKHFAEKMQMKLKCHGKCIAAKSDRKCHAMCPKPLQEGVAKCKRFEQKRVCHKACAHGDHKCHHKCHHEHHGDHHGWYRNHHDGESHGNHHGWHPEHHEFLDKAPIINV